jgi:solute carrier family 44 protein 1 (choline transporter-like protein)
MNFLPQAFDITTNTNLDLVAALRIFSGSTLFFAKVLVSAVVGVVALLLLKERDHPTIYATPLVVICVFAYFIAHCIVSVYEVRTYTE